METDSYNIGCDPSDTRYLHLPPSITKHPRDWLGSKIAWVVKYEWQVAFAGLALTFIMALISLTRSVVTRDEFGELSRDVKSISEKVNLMVGRQEILMDRMKK